MGVSGGGIAGKEKGVHFFGNAVLLIPFAGDLHGAMQGGALRFAQIKSGEHQLFKFLYAALARIGVHQSVERRFAFIAQRFRQGDDGQVSLLGEAQNKRFDFIHEPLSPFLL